jgi:hypothetical protein
MAPSPFPGLCAAKVIRTGVWQTCGSHPPTSRPLEMVSFRSAVHISYLRKKGSRMPRLPPRGRTCTRDRAGLPHALADLRTQFEAHGGEEIAQRRERARARARKSCESNTIRITWCQRKLIFPEEKCESGRFVKSAMERKIREKC